MRGAAQRIAQLLAAGCAGACSGEAGPAGTGKDEPRRVLLVTFDTTRADRLGCYGSAAARTPFLDAMAREGVRFTRAWCAAPITLPSHATLLTGVPPCAHGVRDNGLFALGEEARTLAEALRGEGFATGAFVGGFVLDARFGLAQGFDVYRGPPASRRGLEPEVVERPAAAVVDDAIAWLDGLGDDASFLLWAHFYDPHFPHQPPAPFHSGFAHPYDGEIASCDAALARMHERLARRGFTRGLLEVFTSDHGEGFGEHGEDTHGLLLHDATMRVPLLARGAGIEAGAVVDDAVSLAQVAPAVLRWLGLAAELLPDARARPLPLRAGETGGGSDEESILLETFLPFDLHRWHPLQGLVWRGRKLVAGRRTELFDLAADPREERDLAVADPEALAAMARRLEAALREHAPLGWEGSVALSAEEREQLRRLGYASGGAAGALDASDLPDPRDAIGDEREQMRALELFRKARELSGQDAAIGAGNGGGEAPGRARLIEAKGLFGQAEEILRALVAKHPGDPALAFDLGNVLLSTGRAAEAVPHFESATLADRGSSLHHYNLAIAYAGAGYEELAIAEMEKAIRCDRSLLLAYRWLISAHDRRGELGRALYWAGEVERAGAVEPAELPAFTILRDRLRARAESAGHAATPPPAGRAEDLRPERIVREGREPPR